MALHDTLLGLQSSSLMKLPPREATAESDLTIPFQQSASKSTADQDPLFQHLKIRFIKPAEDAAIIQVVELFSGRVASCTALAAVPSSNHCDTNVH